MSYIRVISDGLCRESDDITFLNPYSYMVFRKQKEELRSFRVMIDGIMLAKFLSFTLGVQVPRISFDMTSIARSVFTEAAKNRLRVAIVGSRQAEIEGFVRTLKKEFVGINVVSYRNGYFSDDTEVDEHIKFLHSCRPQVMVVGMGSGRQEQFLTRVRSTATYSFIGYTCGGFIHQSTKGLDYYPRWVDRMNLRLFFRVLNEKGLMFRHLRYYPLFVACFFSDCIRFKLESAYR
jgi:exopolysaccharide biosynthesis WecB/TagA/CpsF family protein